MKKRGLAILLVLAVMAPLCFLLSSCSSGKTGGSVTIASKQFTENILLSEMYAQLIEAHTDLEVVRKQNLGGTAVCFPAMENGEVDIYIEYTGTIFSEILGREYDAEISREELYDIIVAEMSGNKQVRVFETIGLNNTFALAMLNAKADEMGIKTMSDLNKAADRLVFAANEIFFTRTGDGYDEMMEKYGSQFKSVVKMSSNLLYGAAADDQVDVIVVYTTDALLANHDLLILDDDKHMFPDYFALPIVRNDTLKKHPELAEIMDLLTDSIDNELMQELNYKIDIENKTPEEVAREFLTARGLL